MTEQDTSTIWPTKDKQTNVGQKTFPRQTSNFMHNIKKGQDRTRAPDFGVQSNRVIFRPSEKSQSCRGLLIKPLHNFSLCYLLSVLKEKLFT